MYKNYKKIIAVDPGAKTPIVTCSRSGADSGGFEYKTLKKQRVVYETREHHRERKRLKFIKDVDSKIRNDRESTEKELGFGITCKNSKVQEYTEFQLKWFDEKQKVYEQRRVQRLRFDKYINDQKTNHKIVDEFFGVVGRPGIRKWVKPGVGGRGRLRGNIASGRPARRSSARSMQVQGGRGCACP